MKRQFVVFKVGGEEFAVDILNTREVVLMREITPVPQTHEYVEGVMNLRGSLVPVIDIRSRLRAGRKSDGSENRIIVSSLEGKLTGLIVDSVAEVVRAGDEEIEPPPVVIQEIGADYIAGVINLGSRFITLLDLGKVLTDEILCELDEVLKALSGPVRQAPAPAQAN